MTNTATPPLNSLLAFAEQAARQVGAILHERPKRYESICMQDDFDIKLQADMESEALLRKLFAEQTPDFGVVGEEDGGPVALMSADQPYWVIDPLDGTYNYSRGTPICAVSIGLMRGMKALLGVIYDFNTDTLYSGIPGQGLFVNARPHKPTWATDKRQACVYTGFTATRDYSEKAMRESIRYMSQFKKVRMIGSAAIGLAQVAIGYGDLYWEECTHLWDVAAGIALIEAAGGTWSFSLTGREDFQGIVSAGAVGL